MITRIITTITIMTIRTATVMGMIMIITIIMGMATTMPMATICIPI